MPLRVWTKPVLTVPLDENGASVPARATSETAPTSTQRSPGLTHPAAASAIETVTEVVVDPASSPIA
jgi:hypothetical protein